MLSISEELRRELKKLLSLKDESHLSYFVKTAQIHIRQKRVFLSFRGTNHFLVLISNSFRNSVLSERGLDYPRLSGMILKIVTGHSHIKNEMQEYICSEALRSELLDLL